MMSEDVKPSPAKCKPLFSLGQVVATRGALNTMIEFGIPPDRLIHRHITGDWGDLCEGDQQQNLIAVHAGLRIFSSYRLSADTKIWLITEAERSSTTLLLPSEY